MRPTGIYLGICLAAWTLLATGAVVLAARPPEWSATWWIMAMSLSALWLVLTWVVRAIGRAVSPQERVGDASSMIVPSRAQKRALRQACAIAWALTLALCAVSYHSWAYHHAPFVPPEATSVSE
jgi:hypothetical protein